MLRMLFNNIVQNLNKKQPIKELTDHINKFRTALKNSPFFYNLALEKPFKFEPVKGPTKYKTHNYFIKSVDTNFYNKVRFIISLDILCNERNRNNFDIGVFIDDVNNSAMSTNTIKNISKKYRITAAGVKCKAKHVKYGIKKLKNIKDRLISSVIKIKGAKYMYYDGKDIQLIDNKDNLEDLKKTDKREFNLEDTELNFYEIEFIPEESTYIILDMEKCEYIEIIKHVEHIPLQEYEEIFNVDYNVW